MRIPKKTHRRTGAYKTKKARALGESSNSSVLTAWKQLLLQGSGPEWKDQARSTRFRDEEDEDAGRHQFATAHQSKRGKGPGNSRCPDNMIKRANETPE